MLLLLVQLAIADIPPPDGYVDTCTVERQCPGRGETCQASVGAPEACKPLADQGYTHACNGWGASAWTEVWCKPAAAGGGSELPPAPPPTRPARCDHVGGSALGVALAALALARRRR